MRYYTKEWYELMQKTELTAGLRKVPDKKYTKKDIDALYEKTLKREMAAEKKAYNTAPDLGYLLDILNDRGFCAEDWVVTDLKTGKPRTPASMEEVKNFILEEQQAQTEEFEAREPFSEEDFRGMFRDVYEDRKAELKYGTGSELLDSVDKRLLALELVPESVFTSLKEEERIARREFSRIGRNAERALLKQNVPQDIIEGFDLHDCDLLSIRKKGRNLELIFCIEGMEEEGDSPFRKIVFKGAEITERDKGINIRTHSHDHDDCCDDDCCDHDHHDDCCDDDCCDHDHHHEGCVHSNCTFLISEIYNVKNAFETHMLLWMPSGLKYLTVKAADIEIVNNAAFPEK
ncbi:MAG: DUF4085 domain-containing protein [Clostridia bacterium]|nr:DUF4085 domain-containing protein [Clostridia bacterium]